MIPHNCPALGPEEQLAAQRVLESRWLAQGTEVEAFENEVCAYLGLQSGHAVAVSSGTAALFLALWVLEAKRSAVVCPVYACSALTNAIALAGAVPVMVDTAQDSPNIDFGALNRADTDLAIVPHMFGFPVELKKQNGIRVIEDCAQALGTYVDGKPVGLSGLVGVFSFYATKMITSGGQGGMLVSGDRRIIDMVRDYRQFDCRDDRRPRFNFQMTDLQAAVGREQLRKLPLFLSRRREIFEQYRDAGLDVFDVQSNSVPARYRTIICSNNPQRVIDTLAQHGIKAIVPVNDWELLGPADNFPNAAAFARTTVSLPTYPSLMEKDVLQIVSALKTSNSD